MNDIVTTDVSLLHRHGNAPAPWALRAKNIHLRFGGRAVLRGIDIDIRPGTVNLLRGPNGAGKTCLIDVLCGMREPDAGRILLRDGGRVRSIRYPRSLWRRVLQVTNARPESFGRWGTARTWQEGRLFERLSLRDNLRIADRGVDGEQFWSILLQPSRVRRSDRQAAERAQAMLDEFGLGDRSDSPAGAVSLGQAKRVGILRALTARPQVLFLDEPLQSLDGVGVKDMLAVLHRLPAVHNVALVIVEHTVNVPPVLGIATEVWTLDKGMLRVETPHAVRAELGADSSDGVPEWLFAIAGADAVIERHHLPNGATLIVATRAGANPGDVVLSVNDLVVCRGSRLVIGRDTGGRRLGMSFSLRRGQVAALLAPNGWGKSTLVAAAVGLLAVTSGDIRFDGRSIVGQDVWHRAKAGMAVLQSTDHSFSDLTTREVLRLSSVESPSRRVEPLLDTHVGNLSSGERQLLSFDCALGSGRFSLGLLDEPFRSLDNDAAQRLCTRLSELLPGRALLVTVPRAVTRDGQTQESEA